MWRIRRRRQRAARERQRERVDDAPREIVLQMEQVSERRQHRMRRQQRPARRLDQLRGGAQLIARAQHRSHHHPIDADVDGERLQVRRVAAEAHRAGGRAHDQRAEARHRRGDRVRKTEREEVGLGIRAKNPEGQDHQAGERTRHGRRIVAERAAYGTQLLGHSVRRGGTIRGTLGERVADHAVDGRDRGRTRQRGRLLVEHRVQDFDDVAAAECRSPREHLEAHRTGCEQIAAMIDVSAGHLFRGHVARRAHHDAGGRQIGDRPQRAGDVGIARSCQTKIEQLHAVRREKTFEGLRSR